jgi:hypothetical protein
VDYTLKTEVVPPSNDLSRKYYGETIQFVDGVDALYYSLANKTGKLTQFKDVEVQILPGEEVLTQWLDILKHVIRDVKYLNPYVIYRNPQILHSNYPTTSFLTQRANLVFHTAYHMVEFSVVEGHLPNRYPYPQPNYVGIQTDDS